MTRFALAALAVGMLACGTEETPSPATGAGGRASTTTTTSGSGASGGHGCFSTEDTCDGKCVDVQTNAEHCGMCGHSCADGPNSIGSCVDGQCSAACASGFADTGNGCQNFFGAHEAYPDACAGCAVQNQISGDCTCPAGTDALPLLVQSDCPGMPMRATTEMRLCLTSGVGAESDFGGAYQMDDVEGWCGGDDGGSPRCRFANPQAGGTCACPTGFEPIALRSILRLPCNGNEGGSTIFLCHAPSVAVTTFGGAYQVDDFAPNCRVANPRTGDCSCPAGTTNQVHRVMVDGANGLYGSTIHLCLP